MRLKLAFVHKIDHHIDIGLLELFLLTYPDPQDYHCIYINPELNKETPNIIKSLIKCFAEIQGQHRIILANQKTPQFWKQEANLELICLRELLEFQNDWHYVILKGICLEQVQSSTFHF